MRIIKSTMLAMLAASLSIASFTASANEDDWRALQRAKINANTGKIIKTESDGERRSGGRPEVSLQQAIITAERETQGKAIKADLENRGDRDSYYEVETIRRNTDYEVKIDARSGKVLHIDRDD